MPQGNIKALVALCLCSALAACGGGGASTVPSANTSVLAAPAGTAERSAASAIERAGPAAAGAAAGASSADDSVTSPWSLAINAGGGLPVGAWVADEDYSSPSNTSYVNVPIDTSHVSNPAPEDVYQTQRFGNSLTYTIPGLTPGAKYTVREHFVESYWNAPNERIFNVSINGNQVLTNFDIFRAAGGKNIAVIEETSANADGGGRITIAYTRSSAMKDKPTIAAIEVIGGTSPTPTPSSTPVAASDLAINAGGAATGGSWIADEDYSSGTSVAVGNANVDTSHVTNPAPQAVYHSQRYANSFTYTIPGLKAGGAYTVRLHFVESYWNSAGERLFNVSINGKQDLTNFDIFAAAGGENIAVIEQESTDANSSGTIAIAFTRSSSSNDSPAVAGLEIIGGTGGATPTPSPTPTSIPTTTPAGCRVKGSYFAGCFGNNPFIHKVSTLLRYGGTVRSQTITNNFWAQGYTGGGNGSPLWQVSAGDPSGAFKCEAYGTCDFSGRTEYMPSFAENQCYTLGGGETQCNFDYHSSSFDTVYNHGEIDGEGCGPSSGNGNAQWDCGWGGYFPFSGDGLSLSNNNSGNAAGWAWGLSELTPVDLEAPAILHGLGIVVSCTSVPTVYPASKIGTDSLCGSSGADQGGGPEPTPSIAYGNVVALKPNVAITGPGGIANGASSECIKILTAIQTYGLYIQDTSGGWGIGIPLEPYEDYALAGVSPNPWDAIAADMRAHGDATGSGQSIIISPCITKHITSASLLESLQINPGGDASLPPKGTI